MEAFTDDQLKQALMDLLRSDYQTTWHRAIRYDRAWVCPNEIETSVTAIQRNSLRERERNMWSARIRSVYKAIEGFAAKPSLIVKRTVDGHCFIQLNK